MTDGGMELLLLMLNMLFYLWFWVLFFSEPQNPAFRTAEGSRKTSSTLSDKNWSRDPDLRSVGAELKNRVNVATANTQPEMKQATLRATRNFAQRDNKRNWLLYGKESREKSLCLIPLMGNSY